MQRLGLNKTGYAGQTIDIQAVLRDDLQAARKHGWSLERLPVSRNFRLLAFHRCPGTLRPARGARDRKVYLSTGIHGDEPAGPLAMRQLLQEDLWPANAELWICPCLNPTGFPLNRRENAEGQDLNRDYRHLKAAEVQAHVAWLERQPPFDLTLLLHEDWEMSGFYLYELNPNRRPSLAEVMVEAASAVCPIEHASKIEDRPAQGGIIRPNLDPATRPQWAEAFYLIQRKTPLSYTLEAPSDFPLPTRVAALVTAVRAGLKQFCAGR